MGVAQLALRAMGQACCKEGPQGEISAKEAMAMVQANSETVAPVTETAKPTIVTDTATTAKVLSLTVTRANKDTKWGLVWCENDSEPNTLRVKNIRPGQAFNTYNESASAFADRARRPHYLREFRPRREQVDGERAGRILDDASGAAEVHGSGHQGGEVRADV